MPMKPVLYRYPTTGEMVQHFIADKPGAKDRHPMVRWNVQRAHVYTSWIQSLANSWESRKAASLLANRPSVPI
jgi:hypothetical protein